MGWGDEFGYFLGELGWGEVGVFFQGGVDQALHLSCPLVLEDLGD